MTREEAIEIVEYARAFNAENTPLMRALDYMIAALRPVSREQVEKMRSRWITVVEANGEQYSKCAACQNGLDGLEDAYSFCPHCGAPMTDEAVEMVMKRLEALNG